VSLKGETTWGTLSVAYDFAGGADLAEGSDEIRAARLLPLYLSNAWASSHS
jgi:hypothetical protein